MTTDVTGESYTHRQWNTAAEQVLDNLRALLDALDAMCARVADDDGDQSQIAAIRSWMTQVEACVAQGGHLVAEVNTRQVPVGEAVAAAGGPENTPHKQYAGEARA